MNARMRRWLSFVGICVSLLGVAVCIPAAATEILNDPLDGSDAAGGAGNRMSSSDISFETGVIDNAATFISNTGNIRYDKSKFPLQGTVSLYVKINQSTGLQNLLCTIGNGTAVTGDMILRVNYGYLELMMFDASDRPGYPGSPKNWMYATRNSALSTNVWHYVAASYGCDGMKLYVDGVDEYEEENVTYSNIYGYSNYTMSRADKDVYAGDYPGDTATWAPSGCIDHLRTSNIQSDQNLIVPIDTTPPSTPVVTDDGVCQSSLTTLHASWSAADAESGIAEYQYAIGTSPTDPGIGYVLDWTVTGTNTSITRSDITLSNGRTYYFYVKAKNEDGFWSSVGVSDGITTPPSTPIVTIGANYTLSTTQLSASWSAFDPETSINEYRYAIGRIPVDLGSGYVVPWTSIGTSTSVTRSGLSLSNGEYYFYVKAKNSLGIWSEVGVSNSIRVYDQNDKKFDDTNLEDDAQFAVKAASRWLMTHWSAGSDGCHDQAAYLNGFR